MGVQDSRLTRVPRLVNQFPPCLASQEEKIKIEGGGEGGGVRRDLWLPHAHEFLVLAFVYTPVTERPV